MPPIPLLKYHLDVQKIVLHDFFRAVLAVVHSADPLKIKREALSSRVP